MALKSKVFLVFLILFISCQRGFKDEESFLKWLSNRDNGFVKKASGNGFSLTMKYLPPQYLALLEAKKVDGVKTVNDDLYHGKLKQFKDARTFLLTFEHDEKGVDITKYGVTDMIEFKKRMNTLNFGMKEFVHLRGGDGIKHSPVLASFENIYEINNKKTFYIVFSKDLIKDKDLKDLDVTYVDEIFETGISHFVFDKEKIDKLPKLNFIHKK